jgi:hypothetical protein
LGAGGNTQHQGDGENSSQGKAGEEAEARGEELVDAKYLSTETLILERRK